MEDHISSERHWTLDPFLQVYFLSAALVACVLLLLGILLNVFPIDEARIPPMLRIVGGVLLGAGGAASALFLWLSMWWYWWQVDRREARDERILFVGAFLGKLAGSASLLLFRFPESCRTSDRQESLLKPQVTRRERGPSTADLLRVREANLHSG